MLAHVSYWLNPLWDGGYQFWSGIGSDIGEVLIFGGLVAFYHRHNCHVHKCWRLSWHPHPEHGHPVCRKHHPDHKKIGV